MSHERSSSADTPDSQDPFGSHDDAGVEELLREVGARAEPSTQLTDTVREAVHAEWRALVQARAGRRRIRNLAMAAGVVGLMVAGTVVMRIQEQDTQPQRVATIARVEGHPQIEVAGQLHEAQPGEILWTGMRLQTAEARVALNFGTGKTLSLRIDAGSQVRFSAPDVIDLQQGGVYVDAGANSVVPLTIQTEAGAVRHLGTQYQVRTVAGVMRGIEVSVREGRVQIASNYGTNTGTAGERVAVSNDGSIARSALAPYDASWQWAQRMAPPFDIEGRALSAFLEWLARETGRELVYDSAAVRRAAVALELRGSIAGLNPDQALPAVLDGTKFQQRDASAGSLSIALKRD